jgi:hypothetical protein
MGKAVGGALRGVDGSLRGVKVPLRGAKEILPRGDTTLKSLIYINLRGKAMLRTPCFRLFCKEGP